MTKDLIPPPTQLALIESLPENASLAQVIRVALLDERITAEKLAGLLAVQQQAEKWQAEKEFVEAFARLKFPPIAKTAKSYSSTYAPLDEIQAIIDPILASEGFTLSFSSGEPNEKGLIPIHGLLSHRLGHSRPGVLYLPAEKASSAMNNTQAMGSAISYGERYLAKMMLNLRFVGIDNDGRGGSITENQALQLDDLIMKSDANMTSFLATYGVKVLRDLPAMMFDAAKRLLDAKLAAKNARAK